MTLVGQQFGDDTNGIHLTRVLQPLDRAGLERRPDEPRARARARPDARPRRTDGTTGSRARAPDYALAVNGVRLQGDVVERQARRIDALPARRGRFRLSENQTGVAADGWMGKHAAYNRFDVTAGRRAGFARVTLSTAGVLHGEAVPPADARFASGRSASARTSNPRSSSVTELAIDRGARRASVAPSAAPPPGRGGSRSRSRPSCPRSSIPAQDSTRARCARRLRLRPLKARARRVIDDRPTAVRGHQVREAKTERETRERPAALGEPRRRDGQGRQRPRCGTKNGRSDHSVEPGRAQVGDDVLEAVLARVQVEDELPRRVRRHVLEERPPVARVVDGAKHASSPRPAQAGRSR